MREWLTRTFLILLCAGLFILCDALSADWGKRSSSRSLVFMLMLAPAGFLLFGYLNRKHQLALVSGWVNVTVAVGTVLVGIWWFGDQLTLRQGFGLVLAVISLLILLT